MTRLTIIIFNILFLLTISCRNAEQKGQNINGDSLTTQNIPSASETQTMTIDCDTVYNNKGYTITLTTFDTSTTDETVFNSVFKLSKLVDGYLTPFFSDTVETRVQAVRFDDFNNDSVRDILVQHTSDARSNWTYYLYLMDTAHDKLTKIRGFEEIKNPNYLSEYNLIDNYVVSGHNWTTFYKIQGDTVKNFDIVIYDDEEDHASFKREYQKAVSKILVEKNNR
jgi:hypothetical protein